MRFLPSNTLFHRHRFKDDEGISAGDLFTKMNQIFDVEAHWEPADDNKGIDGRNFPGKE
jgi:hypothetical protein